MFLIDNTVFFEKRKQALEYCKIKKITVDKRYKIIKTIKYTGRWKNDQEIILKGYSIGFNT